MSNLRLRDCINKENDLIDYAIELGHKAVAITDHDSISSAVKVEKYAKKIKEKYPDFKVIRGNEIYLVRNGLNSDNYNSEVDRYFHFVLLAKDLIGFRQICEISTRAWKRSYMARGMRRVPTYYQDLFDIIGENPGHVIGSTACLGGALPTQLLRAKTNPALLEKIDLWIKQMDNLFGHGNFFFELQPSNNADQVYVNKSLINLSEKFSIPYIITTDSHYLKKEDREIHKAYLNAQNGDREVDDFYATTYMMNTEELEKFFGYLQPYQLELAYDNIESIINKCEEYSILKPLKIPELKWMPLSEKTIDYDFYFDKMPSLRRFKESSYKSDSYLADAVIEGIQRHPDLQNDEAYEEINACLEDTWESSEVNNARWSAYFLNLQNIIEVCWDAGTLIGPSRGSGGGFILLYLLGITQINPLRETTKCYRWRFLNPQRASVLDIDTDIEGGRRAQVLAHLKEYYGADRVSNVATFRTEKSKSAILTAARGLGIDVDIAQYIASLVPADRGQLRSLDECMYGNDDKGFLPIKQFIFEMTENYPELWKVAHSIEGLICGSGIHAGGVIFVDEPFTNSTALMRAPDGTICTQFELHDSEDCSLIKMDLLSVEALDKIHNCLDLLCEYGYIEQEPTLRATYEKTIGIYNLERDDPKMWEMVHRHEIQSLFQMEKQSGISGIEIAKPKSVGELAVLNSVIRLMASEKGAEQPLDMWARYRNNIDEWFREMEKYGLTYDQQQWLASNNAITDGICESQEGLMSLVQDELVGGNSLTFADKCRKAIAKKQGKLFEECEEAYFENAKEKGCDMRLAHYVWDVVFKPQKGYSFCRAHTLAYSLIALQEMNLAYKYPILFWNTACLISDSGGNDFEDEEDTIEPPQEEEYFNEMEEFGEDDKEEDIEDSYEEGEDCDGYPVDVCKMKDGKKKKKVKAVNYGKIAAAIGKIKATGVLVSPPDINKSTFTFSPDIDNNMIRYGLSGITRVGADLVKTIIASRPYTSPQDFLGKVKVNKIQMINLIKSGAFDSFGDRYDIMVDYVKSICGAKQRITLQNMKMLIDFGLIPDEYDMCRRVFNFNKYLKKMKLDSTYYGIDVIAFTFIERNFNIDSLVPSEETESGFKIKQTVWKKVYDSYMDKVRPFVQKNKDDLLKKVNDKLMSDTWDKYCKGTLSKWEMDSISCYIHDHEFSEIDFGYYGWDDFGSLPDKPVVERIIPIKGKMIPIFKLSRIAGTVLDRDKSKKTVTLLTTSGVVTVKIYGVFQQYDKQISEKGADGKKHVIRRSEFSRGNKIIVTGIKQGENEFLAKKYSKTPWHMVETIGEINGGEVTIDNRNDEEE